MARPAIRTYTLVENGRQFTVFRKRVKNIVLRMKKSGPEITAPLGVSDDRLRFFISKHSAWIEKKADKFDNARGKVRLFGTYYDREDYFDLKPSVTFEEGVCRIGGKDSAAREKALLVFYKDVIKPLLPGLFAKWEKETGLRASEVTITSAKSYLGRCEVATRKIKISCRLAEKPQSVLDYVVLHELCHIKISGHQKNFYALISKYMPDYKQRIRLMRRG